MIKLSKELTNAKRRVSTCKTNLAKQEKNAKKFYAMYMDNKENQDALRQSQYWYEEAKKTKIELAEAEQKLQDLLKILNI